MHNERVLEDEIREAVWFFRQVERLRTSCKIKLTHLGKRRKCVCGAFYYPRVAKTRCPECGGKLKSVNKVMTCPACGYKAGELGCRLCKDKEHFELAPLDHRYIREFVLPQLIQLEEGVRARVRELVAQHPVWVWAEAVPGLAERIVGDMLAYTDIERCYTLSKFMAHIGWGLRKDGTVQRKVRGEKIDYDPNAKAAAYIMANTLIMIGAKGTGPLYYDFYMRQKEDNRAKGLTAGQVTSRAFRETLQLACSHFWEKWRESVGLDAPEPYPYVFLQHAMESKISPEKAAVAK